MNRVAGLLALGLLALATGCGADSGGTVTLGCDRPYSSICNEYLDTTESLRMSLEDACLAENNAFVVSRCSPDGLVGICTLPIGSSGASNRTFFYDGSADSLRMECVSSQGGTWTPA